MANYKVAVVMLLVAVFSDSHSECLNRCDNDADICLDNCGTHSCANGCSQDLSICYSNCDDGKKSRLRERDQKNDKGLYDIFQK